MGLLMRLRIHLQQGMFTCSVQTFAFVFDFFYYFSAAGCVILLWSSVVLEVRKLK
jgi:hypothetical protein